MKVKFFILIILLLGWSNYTHANTDNVEIVSDFILNISSEILAIRSSNTQENEKLQQIKTLIEKYVDIENISNFALFQQLKLIDNEKQLKLKKAYQDYLVAKYAKLLSMYNGKIKILSIKSLDKDRFLISSEVPNNNNKNINISYYIAKKNGTLLIYDIILIDGISLALSGREEVNSFVERNGIDALIAKLEH